MDKLQREHEFINDIWQLIKHCEQAEDRGFLFWNALQDRGQALADKYKELTFVTDWVIAYMKFLNNEG